jgi:hypothetical protein
MHAGKKACLPVALAPALLIHCACVACMRHKVDDNVCLGGASKCCYAAVGHETQCQQFVALLSSFALYVVNHCGAAVLHRAARPVPFMASMLNGFIAFIGIQIGIARPNLPRWLCMSLPLWQMAPAVPSGACRAVNRRAEVEPSICMHTHLATHTVRPWHADFIDINHQRVGLPCATGSGQW